MHSRFEVLAEPIILTQWGGERWRHCATNQATIALTAPVGAVGGTLPDLRPGYPTEEVPTDRSPIPQYQPIYP